MYEILEAFSVGKIDDNVYSKFMTDGAEKIKDISKNLSIWKNGQYYVLKKDNTTVVGSIKLSTVSIHDYVYNHVDGIYIIPKYRNSSAIKWLLHSVKENSNHILMADGAIFKDGMDLINSLHKHDVFKVKILNKKTGEITPYTSPINDLDKCYIFEKFNTGYCSSFLYENGPVMWFNFFDDIL